MFWQGALELDAAPVVRHQLDERSWIDLGEHWLADPDQLLTRLVAELPWRQRRVRMYDRLVDEPRLTWWAGSDGLTAHPCLEAAAARLGQRYHVAFDSVSANFYRDGRDSVAWHADRIRHHAIDPFVAIVTLGSPRTFLVRPTTGGRSRRFAPGHGDLLVMGGACQHDWQHCVPKVAAAEPRLSVMFRRLSDLAPYD